MNVNEKSMHKWEYKLIYKDSIGLCIVIMLGMKNEFRKRKSRNNFKNMLKDVVNFVSKVNF